MRKLRKDIQIMRGIYVMINVAGMVWALFHVSQTTGWATVVAFVPWVIHLGFMFAYERLPLLNGYVMDEFSEGMEFGYEAGQLVQAMEQEQDHVTIRVRSDDVPGLRVYADRYAYGIEILSRDGTHCLIQAQPQMEHSHGPWG